MNSAYLFSVCLIILTSQEIAGINFYPFNTLVGDKTLAVQDDAFTMIPIMFDFPFFGEIYQQLFISTNGIITFGDGTASFVPQPFPLADLQGVAAYWTDSDPRNGGSIFYREEFSPGILKQITDDVRSRFVQHSMFSSSWALVVTFYNVRGYKCGCGTNCSAVVNHQTILTSDGINSFAIFLYDRLDYTAGMADCSAYAQIGFNAGDGKRFYLVPSSNTPNISNVALKNSNVGIPSKWMFSIGEDIYGVCNTQGLLAINPRKIFYFGNQDILITGPCFTANDTSITVYFGKESAECVVLGRFQLKCSVPLLDTVGRIPVAFQYSNTSFKSFLISAGLEDTRVTGASITSTETDPDSKFIVRWGPSSITDTSNITITGYQIDINIDQGGSIHSIVNTAVKYENISNTGEKELYPIVDNRIRRSSKGKVFRLVMLLVGGFAVTERVLVELGAPQLYCHDWYARQPSQQEMKNIVDKVSRRSPCPPGVLPEFPNQMPNFTRDDSCNPNSPGWCDFFHPGAKGCYRSTNNGGGPAVQCCYDYRNELIIGPPGGGTLDWVDSELDRVGHLTSDVLSYIACCKLSSNCEKYYEKRPSVSSRFYVPPRPVRASGDPHFVTLDGLAYDFNPIGEFIYFKCEEDEVQVRISQYTSTTGRATNACYFSAFVFKSNSSEIIQVELNALQTFTVKVNGESLTLDQGSWNLNSIYLSLINNATLIVQTRTGLNFEIVLISKMLHLIISIPDNFKGKVSGLIGNWDNNQENDLMLPNGTWIPTNSSKRDIHYKFGMAWQNNNKTTLFSYADGLFWKDYQNSAFVPDFSSPSSNPTCGNDAACLYDFHVTGDKNVGLTNLIVQNRTEAIVTNYARISETCSSQVTIPNADVSIRNDSSSIHYSIHCHSGFELIGDSEVTCTLGKYTSSFGICDGLVHSSTSSTNLLTSSWISSLVIFLIGMTFVVRQSCL